MLIKYRGILAERTEDVPYGEYGALVVAMDCHRNCPGCFNQHLKNTGYNTSTPEAIVDFICDNPLHTWCILGGLEWSEDPLGMVAIAQEAMRRGLKVIIYTGCREDEFMQRVDQALLKGCYIKFGEFDENLRTESKEELGVKIASSNQYIVRL